MRISITAMAAVVMVTAGQALAADVPADAPPPPMAPFCAGCHAAQPGVMMGFLDTVSTVVQAIQLDFGGHKEVLRYTADTRLENVASFEDLARYKRKGFRVDFEDRAGRKQATAITRFDIAATIGADEKLSKAAFKQALADAAVSVFDVRPVPMYQAAHVPGAASLPATAVAALAERLPADRDARMVLYGPGGCLAPTTALRVKQLGYTDVKIYPPGLADWVATEYSVTTPEWLRRALDDKLGVIVIDVRAPDEAQAGHIRGAVNIPLHDFAASRDRFPPVPKAPIVLYGEDAAQAARLLVDWGYRAVRQLPMRYADWAAAGNPVASGPGAEAIVYDPKPKPGAIRVADFAALAKAPRDGLMLVDLRDDHEIWLPPVAHAVNIPFHELAERMQALPPARIPVFYCPTGARAEMAHSIFVNAGRESRFLEPGAIVDAEGKVRLVGR